MRLGVPRCTRWQTSLKKLRRERSLATLTHKSMSENHLHKNHRVIKVPYNGLPPEIRAQIDALTLMMGDSPQAQDITKAPVQTSDEPEADTRLPGVPRRRAPGAPIFAEASKKAAAQEETPVSAYASAHIDEIFAAQAIASTKDRQIIRNHMAADAEIIRIGIAMNPHTDRDILEMLAVRNEGDAVAIAKTRIADLDHAEASLRDSATQQHSVQDLEAKMDPTGITVIRHVTGNLEIEKATVIQCLGLMSDVIRKELDNKFHQS